MADIAAGVLARKGGLLAGLAEAIAQLKRLASLPDIKDAASLRAFLEPIVSVLSLVAPLTPFPWDDAMVVLARQVLANDAWLDLAARILVALRGHATPTALEALRTEADQGGVPFTGLLALATAVEREQASLRAAPELAVA